MKRPALLLLAFLCAGSASAATLDLDAVNGAEFSPAAAKGKGVSPVVLKAQVLLDRARFSPGVIDGKDGSNFRKALGAFEKAQGLKADGVLDKESWGKLAASSPEPVLRRHRIAEDEVKGPFTESIPEKFEEKADLPRLGYRDAVEALSERFHVTPDLLRALNGGRAPDKAGEEIVVAAVGRAAEPERTGSTGGENRVKTIEVDKKARELRALAEDGRLIAVYPASIGSEEKPAPSGRHTVRAIARNPTYTYNPDYKFKGVKADKKFTIKPGPNNPVGTVWIDLSVESFGIHGTPDPEKVGKTASHGCVRLTNWDAEALAGMVVKGTEVAFLD